MAPLVTLAPSATRTRVLVMLGPDELLRANLPPLHHISHERAVKTLLEALSLWLGERLCVALFADEPENFFKWGLTDELGLGARTVYYAVEVVEPRRRRGARIRGLGDFRELRQLTLLAWPGGES
jgi:hypothetical protein